MNFAAFERAQVAAFAYREARHTGSLDCMRATCFILRNRKNAHWGDGTWLSLIAVSDITSSNARPFVMADAVSAEDRMLQLIVRDVDDIYLSQEPYEDRVRQVVCGEMAPQGLLGGASVPLIGKPKPAPALYYSFVDREIRPWFVENIIRKPQEHAHVGQIGTMMLYR